MAFIPRPGGFGGAGPPRGGMGFGQAGPPLPGERLVGLGSFKKGGKVKKTGKYKLEKGERVLTKAQQKKRKKDTHAFVAGRRA